MISEDKEHVVGPPAGPDPKMPYSAVEAIDRKKALALLETNTTNRTLSRRAVERFVGILVRGEYHLNGESVKVSKDGKLLDGQHRLAAVAECGVSMTTFVTYNLDDETLFTVDQGRRKTLSDLFQMRGEKNASKLSSAVAWLWRWEHGLMGVSGVRPTADEAFETLKAHPGIRAALTEANRLNFQLKTPVGMSMMLYYVFSRIDEEDAEYFWDQLVTGEGLEAGQPIYALRKALINEIFKSGSAKRKKQEFIAAYFVKAWNAYRENRPLHIVSYKPGGKAKEAFPVAV